MVYSNHFVICIILPNGQIVRDKPDGSVEIPWGTEYKIRMRNKHNRRAVAKLFIDGEERSKGGYVIPARGYVDIERDSYSPRKFMLAAPTSLKAHEEGKDPDNTDGNNGVIEVRFYLEKEHKPLVYETKPRPRYRRRGWSEPNDYMTLHCSAEALPKAKSSLERGVTVEGSVSEKEYRTCYVDHEDQYTSLKMFLHGFSESEQNFVSVYSETEEALSALPGTPASQMSMPSVLEGNEYCTNCGKKVKATHNFCSTCGKQLK